MSSSRRTLSTILLFSAVATAALLAPLSIARAADAAATPAAAVAATPPACTLKGQPLVDACIIAWLDDKNTWRRNKWLGIPTWQNPLDVWITQEIMSETKPDFVVEAGTLAGGSAALWATILEQVNPEGRVITIDIANHSQKWRDTAPIIKRKVDFLIGSSIAPETVAEVKKLVGDKKAMVILDSLHTKDHVLEELRAYAPFVPVGGYIIVQDGEFNGHPAPGGWGPGPYEAVDAFLAETDDFVIDADRERLLFTFNPHGFLKRVK